MSDFHTTLKACIIGLNKSDSLLFRDPALQRLNQAGGAKPRQLISAVSLWQRAGSQCVTLPQSLAAPNTFAEHDYNPLTAKQKSAATGLAAENIVEVNKYLLRYCHHHKWLLPNPLLYTLVQQAENHSAMQYHLLYLLSPQQKFAISQIFTSSKQSVQRADDDWLYGSPINRKAALLDALKSSPATALAMIEETWKSDKAAERQQFLQLLPEYLEDVPESWFIAKLNDKSKAVNETLGTLLVCKNSAYVKQEVEPFLAAFLKIEKKMLKTSVVIDPPENYSSAWKRYGVQEKKPASFPFSKQSYWLIQLLQLVKPSEWIASLGVSMEKLLSEVRKSDYRKELQRGLRLAAIRYCDKEYMRVDHSAELYELVCENESTLLSAYTQQDLQWLFSQLLVAVEKLPKKSFYASLHPCLLPLLRRIEVLSPANSQQLLAQVQQQYEQQHLYPSDMFILSVSLHVAVAERFGTWLKARIDRNETTNDSALQLLRILKLRTQLENKPHG